MANLKATIKIIVASAVLLSSSACSNAQNIPGMMNYSYVPAPSAVITQNDPGINSPF